MKKFFLLSILIVGLFNVYSQTPVTLSFTGKDSITQLPVILDSVMVKNLDFNCDTLLNGPSPVLAIMAGWPVGINKTAAGSVESIVLSQNFPNPFQGSTQVGIYMNYPGTLNLALSDLSGVILAEYHSGVEKGLHSFKISSSGISVLFLKAWDNKNCSSIKIVCNGQGIQNTTLQYLGPTADHRMEHLKSLDNSSGFIFNLGDQMMYTAYAAGYHDKVKYDAPFTSTVYSFSLMPITVSVTPSVTTSDITNISLNSATGGGTVTSDGGAAVTARGVCWSTSPNPTTANNFTSDGAGTGSFASYLTGLAGGTMYYVRAYATNSVGTSYGNELTFTTLALPVLTTAPATGITPLTAISGGTITSDGGSTVGQRGVCWSNAPYPSLANSHTSDGSGTGTFVSNIAGLTPNTLYYVRAYAINNAGTAYGNELTFTTVPPWLPVVSTDSVYNITQTTAMCGGNVTADGGAPVTLKGVCWGTTSNPTIAGSHTTDGSGLGQFTSTLTGLTTNLNYYVRAYATNSSGTAYGNQVIFHHQHYMGESYQGGIIFYIDTTGVHGLISATSDQSTSAQYGCSSTLVGASGTAIGTGQANTTAIVTAGCNSPGIAAQICDALVLNGYSDWFLPSLWEAGRMSDYQTLIGGFIGTYWTSTEYDPYDADIMDFATSTGYWDVKYDHHKVRAVRAF